MLIDDQGSARLIGFQFSSIVPPPTEIECLPIKPGMEHQYDDECISLSYVDNVNPATTEDWRWRAPETMDGSEELVPQFTQATDVFSFGMTVYEVCT